MQNPEMTVKAPDGPGMTVQEMTWLANQTRKQTGERSKYEPHQGAREKARRAKRVTHGE